MSDTKHPITVEVQRDDAGTPTVFLLTTHDADDPEERPLGVFLSRELAQAHATWSSGYMSDAPLELNWQDDCAEGDNRWYIITPLELTTA